MSQIFNESKEIQEFDAEKSILERKSESYKDSLIEKMTAGDLINDMIHTLNNPTVITRQMMLKLKIKKFFKDLIDVL